MSNIIPNSITISKQIHPRISNIKNAFLRHALETRWIVSDQEGRPFIPDDLSRYAESNNNFTWGTFKAAIDICARNGNSKKYWPAIAMLGTDLCILDLDNCRDPTKGAILPWAQAIVEQCPGYWEISKSGTGLHGAFLGVKPGRQCKNSDFEIYDGEDKKFITLTGILFGKITEIGAAPEGAIEEIYKNHFPEKETADTYAEPKSPPLDDPKILELLSRAKNKDKFEKLYVKGDISNDNNDDSSADLALISLIAFYTQDPEQIFRVFQGSALYRKPDRTKKWAREDYRTNTIQKAIAGLRKPYQPPAPKEAAAPKGPSGTWENPIPLESMESADHPFPVEELPKSMKEAVLEVERFVQIDPSLALIPALGMLALQIGKKVRVVEKEGLEHHPSLFLVGVMEQVERKSQTCNCIFDPIKDEIEKEYDDYKKKFDYVQAYNDSIDEQMSGVKSQIKRLKSGQKQSDKKNEHLSIEDLTNELVLLRQDKKDPPAPPKNWGDDVTPERLQQQLHIHDGAYGLFSSEGRTIFSRILNKNGNEGVVGAAIYTAMTWGDDIDRSRIGQVDNGGAEDRTVRKPAGTITAFIQRDIWNTFVKDQTMRQSGTISRICFVSPLSRAGTRFENEGDEPFKSERLSAFTQAVMRVRKWKPDKVVLHQLTLEASRARRDFYNEIEREIGPGAKLEDIRDIAGRACSIATRIACCFAVCDEAERESFIYTDKDKNEHHKDFLPPITEEQWLRAETLAEYFLAQAIDCHSVLGEKGVGYLAGKILSHLPNHFKKEGARLRLSRLRVDVRSWRDAKDEAMRTSAIQLLEQAGWIRKTGEPIKGGSGVWYEVNPAIASLKVSDEL